MYKPYVKYSFRKKEETKILTREFPQVATIQDALKQFAESEWLVRRVGYPSTGNLRLCIQQMDVAPENLESTVEMVKFGDPFLELDDLSIEQYYITIRYIRKGAFEPTKDDVGEILLKRFEFEGEVVSFLTSEMNIVSMDLNTIAQTGMVDSPTLCIYYPTNHPLEKKGKGKHLLKEPEIEPLLI